MATTATRALIGSNGTHRVLQDTTIRFGEVGSDSDAEGMAYVNTVNPHYTTAKQYTKIIKRKNEFLLVATHARSAAAKASSSGGAVVGMCHLYVMSFAPKDAKGKLIRKWRAGYVVTLQAVKQGHRVAAKAMAANAANPGAAAGAAAVVPRVSGLKSTPSSERYTGVVLLMMGLLFMRHNGCEMAFLDATKDSVGFYKKYFGFKETPVPDAKKQPKEYKERVNGKYAPMGLSLHPSQFDPLKLLTSITPSTCT
jgi:hypothetical protein